MKTIIIKLKLNIGGPIVNIKNQILLSQSHNGFQGNSPLLILPFPKYTENTDFKKSDLFRTFTENEIDSIVKKLKETRSCIYLTWINERLSTKLILEVSKSILVYAICLLWI